MIVIRDIDPLDERQLRQWYDVWRAAQSHRRGDLIPSWEAAGRPLSTAPPGFDLQLFTAFEDDDPVGVGLLNLPLQDNPTVGYADVMAHPRHAGGCRHGGRSPRSSDGLEPPDASGCSTEVFLAPDGGTGDALFAAARGYVEANREGVKAVELAAAEPGWADLEAQVAEASGGYRVVTWRDRCPEEYLESFGRALSR